MVRWGKPRNDDASTRSEAKNLPTVPGLPSGSIFFQSLHTLLSPCSFASARLLQFDEQRQCTAARTAGTTTTNAVIATR